MIWPFGNNESSSVQVLLADSADTPSSRQNESIAVQYERNGETLVTVWDLSHSSVNRSVSVSNPRTMSAEDFEERYNVSNRTNVSEASYGNVINAVQTGLNNADKSTPGDFQVFSDPARAIAENVRNSVSSQYPFSSSSLEQGSLTAALADINLSALGVTGSSQDVVSAAPGSVPINPELSRGAAEGRSA